MAVLILFFSLILYKYISYDIDREMENSLFRQSQYLFAKYDDLEKALLTQESILKKTLDIEAKIEYSPDANYRPPYTKRMKEGKRYFIVAYFPYDFSRQKYLVLKKDITQQMKMKESMLRSIILLNGITMAIIILYAFIISRMLLSPIRYFSDQIAKMNENILEPLELWRIPVEFYPLGKSVNQLLARISTFLKYKKELFIGAAHEMKTPLAVMRAKNQLALIKKEKSIEDMEKALRDSIASIDQMNRTVTSILEFGRAEGAQFEKAVETDIISFIGEKAKDYALLARNDGKRLKANLHPAKLHIRIQPLLLTQILQNLIQNALRFSPEGAVIKINSHIKNDTFILSIRDEGPGVDESADLFSPFKRSRNSPGTGLGLFLVKSAADALGATVTLKNRKDKKGAVATLRLPLE